MTNRVESRESSQRPLRVLLTGATGFVGRHLVPWLEEAGFEVIRASRSRERASSPGWVRFDLDEPETLGPALEGCDVALFLIHRMGTDSDYESKEIEGARAFARAAETAGVRRIVYLGGVMPAGESSKHLRARAATGRVLREGSVPVVELRAAMIIGPGSESWRIVRDLSLRLPFMVLPAWLENRSEPISVEDVCFALREAIRIPDERVGTYDLPGPEVMSAAQILKRVASLRGVEPFSVHVPFVTPKLSSYWIQFVTRANHRIARELVEGLEADLVSTGDSFWELFPEHVRIPFDLAAHEALEQESRTLRRRTLVMESALRRLAPRAKRKKDVDP